ncbi:hypothetical protein Tco_1250882 [Tanacetum coccineum]
MLDRTDFASWKQRIRLYCWVKENGVNILKSIDEGPFQMGTFRETLVEGDEGALHLGLPKDIYSLINHYTDAKDIWDNHKEKTIHVYMVGLPNSSDMVTFKMTMGGGSRMQVGILSLLITVAEWGRQNRGQGNNAWGAGASGYGGAQNRVGNANPDKMLLMQAQENRVALDDEQLLFITGGQDNVVDEDVDEQLVQDLALNADNVFQDDDCNVFDSDVDEAHTAHTMFMANLSSANPVYDEASP